jgi:hypothetical protein
MRDGQYWLRSPFNEHYLSGERNLVLAARSLRFA